MKPKAKARKRGLFVQPDDFQVGQFYAVHGLKDGSEEPLPIYGQAFRLTALNLPFVVGKLVCDPAQPPLTFDVRFLRFMPVTEDFVQAQRPEPPMPKPTSPIH